MIRGNRMNAILPCVFYFSPLRAIFLRRFTAQNICQPFAELRAFEGKMIHWIIFFSFSPSHANAPKAEVKFLLFSSKIAPFDRDIQLNIVHAIAVIAMSFYCFS